MNNLLNKPLKTFAFYSFIVLLCSIPVYFFMIDFIWIHEIDEHNRIVSESTKQNLRSLKLDDKKLRESIVLWDQIQPETKLQAAPALLPDSTYNIYRKNKYIPGKGYDRFEGLVSYFELNGKFYSVTVETNVEESYETIFAITTITGFFFIVLLMGFIILNKKISRKLWNPFYQSLQKIKAFDLSMQQSPQFEKTDIAEFEEMNNSIGKLIDSNIKVYRQQKEFTENASHELQTPLAVVQSKLDLLLQSSTLSAQQCSVINDTHQALSKVSRINKNLLLLAKIENHQFSGKEKIDLSAHLEENILLLCDFLQHKNLKISQEIQSGVTLESNKVLTEIMLTNLLMNAIRHNVLNGHINICLKGDKLSIANTGNHPLNKEKLFRRFSTASSETPGTGLGLAIVQEICNNQEWNISYKFEHHQHIFCLTF
jgi:signal transduction histidine kinase